MRAVVQRVRSASVQVGGEVVGAIDAGLLVLLSAGHDDDDGDVALIVDKVAGLRVFADEAGKMNRDVQAVAGAVLVVSQFTLHGDVRRGRRPAFTAAMEPVRARAMVDDAVAALRARGLRVATGVFGADMQVASVNDGPVTILIDSKRLF